MTTDTPLDLDAIQADAELLRRLHKTLHMGLDGQPLDDAADRIEATVAEVHRLREQVKARDERIEDLLNQAWADIARVTRALGGQ